MKITDIKTQVHDETRVSVYVDGAYSFSLSDIDAVKHAVKKGREISESDLLFFKSLGDNSKAMKAAMDLISRKGVTQKALGDYLLKKGYSKEVCTFVSNELKNLGYIDDFSTQKTLMNTKSTAECVLKRILEKKAFQMTL